MYVRKMLNQELKINVTNYLLGTSKSESEVQEHFNLSDKQLEDVMSDLDIEICPNCECWVETFELVDENLNLCSCISCGNEL